jgi:hypothetical protein
MPITPTTNNPLAPPFVQRRYLHIGFKFESIPYSVTFEPIFNHLADDWMRYSADCWVAFTVHDAVAWFNAIKPLLRGNDSFLVCELKSPQAMQGWLPKFVWDWLNKQR